MKKNVSIIVVIILLLLIIAALYYFLIHKKNNAFSPMTLEENFDALQKGIGIKSKGPVLVVKFNEGKNQADYYNNGRVVISKVGSTGYIVKGSYRDGGREITLDNGKKITAPTAWGSLEQTII